MERIENTQENKMGVMPVNKLLVGMAWPMIVSMLVQGMYNVVDSIFVSRLSENALTAVSLAFPVQMILIALGTGAGVGMNAVLSRALGEKDQRTVDKAAGSGIFIAAMNFLVFLVVGIFAARPFFASQAKTPEIVEMGTVYLQICCCFSVGVYAQLVGEKLLQATGRTVLSMITQGIGAILNIILDPILIFGYFGAPAMGIAGAAAATVIGQIVGGVAAIAINIRFNKEINIRLKNILKPDMAIIRRIYAVGLPSIIMQSIGSVMNYCMNIILIGFTETAAAVFGIYFKIQSMFFMPVLGLNNGMVPIIAFNYGAGKRSRIIKTAKLGIMYATIMMLMGLALFQLFPDELLLMFDAGENMLSIGRVALRVASLSYVFAGFCIASGSIFQALGNGVYSMIVSFCRQIVVLLPAAYLLSLTGNLDAVWWAIPIAEIMSVLVTSLMLVRINRRIIRNIPDNV
ncbi:MAG: MATE family efflux transporter [Candidatus Heteroscillospira sp.]|jgi:putative MATE family efflux protein